MLHLSTLKYCTTIIGQCVLKIECVFYAQPYRKLSRGLSCYGYVEQVEHVKQLVGIPVVEHAKPFRLLCELLFY